MKQWTQYIPENAIDLLNPIAEKNNFILKIVSNRKSKHGDFRSQGSEIPVITVNKGLNPYAFLITFVHELAHLIVDQKHESVAPHGKQWKKTFQMLMLPFLSKSIFPDPLLRVLAIHMKKPKASTSSDIALAIELKKHDLDRSNKKMIYEIPYGTTFVFSGNRYQKISKKRIKYLCCNKKNGKNYLFHPLAEIESDKINP